MNIEELPDEILCRIFQYLDRYDRRAAMLVCSRWDLIGFGTGANVVLKIYVCEEAYQRYENFGLMRYSYKETLEALLISDRVYQHISLIWDTEKRNQKTILNILSRFSPTVYTLEMHSCGCETDLRWVASVLGMLPNLKELNMNGVFIDEETFRRIDMNPMYYLHTLQDKQQISAFVYNAPDVFACVTTLYVRITKDIPLLELLNGLSPQLVHLTVYMTPKLFEQYSEEEFPSLETLEIFSLDEKVDKSIELLAQIVLRAPKLKRLKLLARNDISVLSHLEPLYGTLEKLAIYVDTLNPALLEMIEKFEKLEHLWLRGIPLVNFKEPNNGLPILTSVRVLVIESSETVPFCDEFYRDCFPNLIELQLQFADPDDHCLKIVEHIPTLRRLIIRNPWYGTDLQHFVEFCRKLKAPEFHITCFSMYKGQWHSSQPVREAKNLEKLCINAASIEVGFYEQMMKLMPALKVLQLALKNDCPDETVRTLVDQFPRCKLVRVLRPDALFLSDTD
ncbi:AAEL008137-PA [Aedes aegypti]|uniref:AAEL008137-PA n=2 Tax=Aedes aegypti TaxID=7159 RepID=A0A1S4FIK4_AEDAE|nr:uncharacterized protein LOC5570170 [Aedes aegypti]EAT40104.1 AAEL008137-PA [Aedes aegypti]